MKEDPFCPVRDKVPMCSKFSDSNKLLSLQCSHSLKLLLLIKSKVIVSIPLCSIPCWHLTIIIAHLKEKSDVPNVGYSNQSGLFPVTCRSLIDT